MSDGSIRTVSTRRRAMWIVLGTIGLVVASAGAIFLDAWISAGKMLEREKARFAEQLEAHRSKRVVRPNLFEPPEEGNAWEPFSLALEEAKRIPSEDLKVFPSMDYENLDKKPDDAAIARMVERMRPIFEKAKQALKRRKVEPAINYGFLDGNENFSAVTKSIHFARLMADAADHKLRLGEDRAALEATAIGFGLAPVVAVKGGTLVDHTRCILNSILQIPLKNLMASFGGDAGDYKWFAEVLDRLDRATTDYVETIRVTDLGCRQLYLKMACENWTLSSALLELPGDTGIRSHLPLQIRGAYWLGIHNRVIRSFEDVSRLKIEDQVAAASLAFSEFDEDSIPLHIMFTSIVRYWPEYVLDRQNMRLARLSVAIAQHRAEKGFYPVTLTVLVPEFIASIPLDPWNGKSFSYKCSTDAAIVYALGRDGDDDGGRAVEDKNADDADGDNVWTVKRREASSK